MSEDIKGVFVRLPLSEDRELVFCDKVGDDDINEAILAIGTPVQPCADVETVGYVLSDFLEKMLEGKYLGINISKDRNTSASCIAWGSENIPLVRRTDMDAQVARVAAEKDAEIARLREYYEANEVIQEKGMWFMSQSEFSRIDRARAALNEGAAG